MILEKKTGKQLDDELREVYNTMMQPGGTTTIYEKLLEKEYVLVSDLQNATPQELSTLSPMAIGLLRTEADMARNHAAVYRKDFETKVVGWANKLEAALSTSKKSPEMQLTTLREAAETVLREMRGNTEQTNEKEMRGTKT